MAGSNAIDLSKLPPPDAVAALDFEAVVATNKALLLELDPSYGPVLALESEPLVKFIELLSWAMLQKTNEVNQGVRAVMPALAKGADLDQLGVIVGITRLVLDEGDPAEGIAPTYESDDDMRRRFVLAPEGFSVAGPEGAYVFHALTADGGVLDASATSPEPGEVVVTVLARDGNGEASAEVLETVQDSLSAETVRPLTDFVTVQSAEVIEYAITASIKTYAGPDATIVLAAAQASIAAFVSDNHRLGRDVNLSGIYAALHVPGVQRVTLTAPVADIIVDRTQATFCTAINVTHGGLDE